MRFDRPVRVGVTAAATLLLVFGLSGGVAAADEQQVPRLEADRMIPTTMVAPPELQAQMTQTRGEPLRVHPRNLRVEDDAKTMSTTILSESFEGSWPSGSWVVGPGSGAPDVYWGKTSYRRANGSYSAWCAKSGSSAPGTGGNVPSGTKSWMIAGPFDLTSFTGGEWAFNLWMESGAFNGGDGDYLGVYASTGGDYYGYFIEGSTTGWQTASLDWAGWYTLGDLNQYNSVYFAIIYTANSSSYEGAYVDDFTLTGEGGGAGGLNLTINQIDPSNCPNNTAIVSVTDDVGDPVSGLGASNFTLHEDGSQQSISVQCGGSATGDLAVALVLDSSGSLDSTDVQNIKDASTQFINMLGANDQIAVWDFDSSVTLLQDYTTNKQAAINAVNQIDSSGYTSLYDAIYDAADHSSVVSGRKALVVMTDGLNNDSSHTQQEAIDQANAMGVPVFTIGFGNANSNVLTNIANQTGGLFYQGATSSDLQTILGQIGQTLSNQCVITWTTSHPDGGSHTVKISVQVGSSSDWKTTTYTQAGTPCGGGGGGREVILVDSNGSPGGTVTVPIHLISLGDENALGFTVTFDTSKLSNPSVTLGSAASGATLNTNTNQASSGRVGIALSLSANQTFASGQREIARVTFNISSSVATGSTTNVLFGDTPIVREISDTSANALPAIWTPGTVTFGAPGYEADVAPRSSGGNGSVTTTDWVQVGRFVAALDTASAGSEFQKADCAPRSSLGNGSITTTDWVQAGRYAAALDPLTAAGGPTSKGKGAPAQSAAKAAGRMLRLSAATIDRGQSGNVFLDLVSAGDENAIGFSLDFNPGALTYQNVALGSGASGATLNVNDTQASSGHLGIVMALPAGETFAAGVQQLVVVAFQAAAGSSTVTTPIAFSDTPVIREVSDVVAEVLPTTYEGSRVMLAAGDIDDPFRVCRNPATARDQDAAVAYNPDRGEYLVVWSDERNAASRGADIWGQRVGADGSLVGSHIRLSGNAATGDEYHPYAVYDSEHTQYMVVWSDTRLAGSQGSDIWSQLVDADGTKLGINRRVTGAAAVGDDTHPSMAYNPGTDTYVVVWSDNRYPSSRGTDIWAQKLTPTNEKTGLNYRISGGRADGDDGAPAIVYNSAEDEFLIAFECYRNNRWTIFGRRLDGGGDRETLNFVVSGTAGTAHRSPSLAYNAVRNEYVLVWSDDRNAGPRGWDIFAQVLTATGDRDGQTYRVCNVRARGDDLAPSIAYSTASDRYAVVWQDGRNTQSRGEDVWGQLLASDGSLAGDELRISGGGATADELLFPGGGAVAASSSGYALVVCTDTRNAGSRGWDVWGRIVDM